MLPKSLPKAKGLRRELINARRFPALTCRVRRANACHCE